MKQGHSILGGFFIVQAAAQLFGFSGSLSRFFGIAPFVSRIKIRLVIIYLLLTQMV
jgi:hypothetical protein